MTKTTIAAIIASAALATTFTAPANAGSNVQLQDACETAVRAELDQGDARINRVSIASNDEQTRFWLTVRHKAPTEAKSTRYRALCTVDQAGATATVELDEGWWKKSRRGQPVAVN
ncbi:MAG: hypothetical protein AAGJ86_09415 [Pseudomonadota bacterium]